MSSEKIVTKHQDELTVRVVRPAWEYPVDVPGELFPVTVSFASDTTGNGGVTSDFSRKEG